MRYFLTSIFFLFFQSFFAQAVSGKVYDAKTDLPIYGVSVYFDGSSVGTITNEEGYFSIDPKFNSNTYLIFSHLGYKTENIPYDKLGPDLRVELQEDFFEVPEVILVSDPFSRRQKLEVFRKEFLGDSYAAENSLIENEDALELYFNSNSNILSAYAKEPIAIVNNYLGYYIRFDLKEFKINFKSKSLKRIDNIESTTIMGHTFFEDISEDRNEFLERRNNTFSGSIQHFLRTLWSQNWLNESFGIRQNYRKVNISDAITVSSGSDIFTKKVTFKLRQFKLTHKKDIFKHWSSLKLLSGNTIRIDKYGSYVPYLQLKFGGYMAALRVGDLLPLDYEENRIVD